MEFLQRSDQLKQLSAAEWRVLSQSMVLLPVIALSLRLKGFKWTKMFLLRYSGAGSSIPEEEHLQVAQLVGRMVSVAARHGAYRTNCLKIALLTWWLLKRKDIGTELKFGANKDGGVFRAHAWVEIRGEVLVGGGNSPEIFSLLVQSKI